MPRFPRLQIDGWLTKAKDKLRMNNKSRFMLLLLFFNGLLIVILLLSVRNQETRQRIRHLDREIKHQIEDLATRRSNLVQIVYITATPLPSLAATNTSTRPPRTSSPSPTITPVRPTRTPRPVVYNTPTRTPVPTGTPTLTPTTLPTPSPTSSPTEPPTLTWTPSPTAVPTIAQVSLVASDTSLPADGQSSSIIHATLLDETGALYMQETAVTFTTDRGTFWGTPRVVVLAQEGSAKAVLTASTSAGIAHIQAQAEQVPAYVEVRFEPGAPHSIALSATPLRLNVGQTSLLEAVVWDANQNYVSDGTLVRFETSLGSIDPPQALTQGGSARTRLSSGMPGSAWVTSFAGQASRSLEVEFVSLLSVTSVTPNEHCNHVPTQITITGTGLNPDVSARLGAWPLQVVSGNGDTMIAIVPPDIAVGRYDLFLHSPTGDHATRPDAYQALDCVSLDTTLESGYLGTYGAESEFAPGQGDDDQRQVLFFQVPEGTAQPLYVRVFDPDCGGQHDMKNGQEWDSSFEFVLYGASGAYTDPDARHPHPTTGTMSGMPLDSATFGQDTASNDQWYSFRPLDATDGERVGSTRVFKLVIQGNPNPASEVNAADLNLYQVALSTSNTENIPPQGARIWAYSWTYLIPAEQARTPPHMYPYIDPNVKGLVQYNWDYDRHDLNAGIELTTPRRTIQLGAETVSGDNDLQFSGVAIQDAERGTTWAVRIWADPGQLADNLVTVWATGTRQAAGEEQALPMYARSTILAPP